MKLARRLDTFEGYMGTAMNVIMTRLKAEGKDVINLGLGDPDVIPTEKTRKVLADACYSPDSHTIQAFILPRHSKKLSRNGISRGLVSAAIRRRRYCRC